MLGPDRCWSALHWQTNAADRVTPGELIDCFNASGLAALADRMPLLLPIDPEWLTSGEFEFESEFKFVEKFRAGQAIFVLPARALDAPAVLSECAALRLHGYHFALHVEHVEAIRCAPLNAFDHLLLDASFARNDLPPPDLVYCERMGLTRIATKVTSPALFDWLAAKRFALCDSSFLTTPDTARAADPDAARIKMLKLLSLIAQDAETRAIEEVFREEPKLSYNLLRLVNSVAIGGVTQISSFNQAIALLGRRQLQRWLQLLIYAKQFGSNQEPNPLMQLAAARGHQMELLCAALAAPPDIPDLGGAAFMTGIFSLLDVLLKLPISEILDALPLQDAVIAALGERRGVLGELLAAVQAGEAGDHARAAAIFATLGIPPASHAAAQSTAFFWASRINLE